MFGRVFIFIMFLFHSIDCFSEYSPLSSEEIVLFNTPKWVAEKFKKETMAQYQISTRLNPYYLEGDLNGDGSVDAAVLILNKTNQFAGIAIFHRGLDQIVILGAGNDGIGGTDFTWMDVWQVNREKINQGFEEGPPPEIEHDSLYIGKSESASGIIFWKNNQYNWYQQGD